MSLQEYRTQLNGIDAEMRALFERRMAVIEKVIVFKKENDLPILDAGRESEMLARGCEALADKSLAPYYEEFLKCILTLSKQYQSTKL